MKGLSSQDLIALVLSLGKSLQRMRMCKREAASGAWARHNRLCVSCSTLGQKASLQGLGM